jgi:isocitrate/isopropylmalate dehydrogenase
MHTICLISGDGIGLDVIPATRRVPEATGLPITFVTADAGRSTFERLGSSVP